MTKFLKNADVTGYISQTSVTSSLLKTDANGKLVAATAGTDYQAPTTALLPAGGTAGQILSKINATDYNTQWIDNFAAQLKHEVKLGATLSKGAAVYVSSANGTNMIVSAASNASEATSSKTLGLLETGGVTNDLVKVITEGLLAGLDTSTATAGDPVWLGVNGALIFGLANKPVAPAHMVFIGIVTRVQSVNGEIFVKVQNGFELDELHNVSISSLANNHTLVWESATSLWKNKTIAAALGYTPADDAAVVKLTGNQTVAGVKTFTSALLANNPSEGATGEGLIAGQSFKIDATGTGQRAIMYVVSKTLSDTYGSGLIAQYANFDGDKAFGFNLNTAGGFELYVKNTTFNKALAIANTMAATFGSSVTATSFIKSGGTSAQFLKADGSVDSTSYMPSITFVSPLVIASGGEVSIGQAGASANGYLSSTDWNTFNNKLSASTAASTYLPLTGGTLTGDLTLSGTNPRLYFTDTDNNPDYFISNTDGTFTVYDVTNSVGRFKIYTTGNAEFSNNVTVGDSYSITNGLTLSGNHISTRWYNGNDTVFANYRGYNWGTTQFRNFHVYDGKESIVAAFNGDTKYSLFYGNVGVGNTNPFGGASGINGMHITSLSANSAFFRINNASYTGFDLIQGNDGVGYLWLRDNQMIQIGTNNTERVRVTNAGRIIVNNSVANDSGDRNLTIQGSLSATLNDVASINLTQVWNGVAYPAILAVQQDLTYGNASGAFVLKTSYWNGSSVVTSERLRVAALGQLKLSAYTSSTSFSGTAAGYLAFDSSGNIITVASVAATDNTKLPFNGTTTRFTGDVNTLGLSGTTGVYNLGVATNAPSTYGTLMGFWNTDISTQVYFSYNGNAYWRPSNSTSFVGAAWRTFLDSTTFSSYALPLTGGSLTGRLNLLNTDNVDFALYHGAAASGSARIYYNQPANQLRIYATAITSDATTGIGSLALYNGSAYKIVLTEANVGSYALPLSGGTMTGLLAFSNTTGNKIDFYHTTTSPGDRYGIQVQNSELRIHSGAGGDASGGITFGKSTTTTFTEVMRVRNDGIVNIAGYLRTAGATSNTILWAGGASSADFGNVLGQGTSTRSTFFRGASSVSAWWGGTDGLGNVIPFTAIDATSGEFTFWRNSGGVGGGSWTRIMTMNASGLYLNEGTVSIGGNNVIHGGNIGSQSVTYATSAGSLSSMNISQFTNNSGYLTSLYGWTNTPDSWYGIGQTTSASGATAVGGYYPWALSYHTGLALSAHSAYGGIRFYNQNYPTGPLASTPVLQIINGGMQANGSLVMNGNDISGVANITSTNYYQSANGYFQFGFTNTNTAQWPLVRFGPADTANGWDEGIIKASTSEGVFGRYGMGIHFNSARAFGIYSSGWTKVFGFKSDGNQSFVNLTVPTLNGFSIAQSDQGTTSLHSKIPVFSSTGNLSTVNPESYSGEVRLGAAWARGGVYASSTLSMSTSSGNINFVSNDTSIGGFRWDSSNGTRFIVGLDGNIATPYTLIDANKRPVIYARGSYPVLTLDHTETSNTNHGPTIQFAFNGLDSRQWVIGASGNGSRLDFGMSNAAYSNTNYNPHNGIAGYQGKTIMRMTETGVLFGNCGSYPTVNSPGYQLQVNGTSYSDIYTGAVSGSSYGTIRIDGTTGGYSGIYLASSSGVVTGMYDTGGNGGNWDPSIGWHFYWHRGNTCLALGGSSTSSNYRVLSNGNLQVSGLIYSTNYIQTSGAIYASGDITAYYSDGRLKENIQVIESVLDKLSKIGGYSYTANDLALELKAANDKKVKLGVIAQEVKEIFPEVIEQAPFDRDPVTGESLSGEHYMTVKYERFVPVLIQGIKEQQVQIESQKSEISELKELVKQLLAK